MVPVAKEQNDETKFDARVDQLHARVMCRSDAFLMKVF